MGTITEIKDIPKKYKKYINELSDLLTEHRVTSIPSFISMYQKDEIFSVKSKAILTKISQEEGGKLSLTTIGIIIGASFGGVGIAIAGGAFGLPLAAIFGIGGFLTGSKIDASGLLNSMQTIEIKVTVETYSRLELLANGCNMSVDKYLLLIVDDITK